MPALRFVTYTFAANEESWAVKWNAPDKYGNRSVSVVQKNVVWHFEVRTDKPTEKASASLVKRGMAERAKYREENK